MAKTQRAAKTQEAAKRAPAPFRRASLRRDEVTDLEGFMSEFGISDKRTAEKLLKAIGCEVKRVGGCEKALVNGESFFQATRGEQ